MLGIDSPGPGAYMSDPRSDATHRQLFLRTAKTTGLRTIHGGVFLDDFSVCSLNELGQAAATNILHVLMDGAIC